MSEPGEWFVSVHGKQDGPLSWRVLIEKVRLGEVRRTDLVWKPGFESWTAAESVNGLFAPSPLPLVLGMPANTSKPVVHSDRPGELAAAVLEAQARAVRPAEKTPETLEELKPSRERSAPPATKTKDGKGGYLRRHWRGELGLGTSYWINVTLLNIVLTGVVGAALAYFNTTYWPVAAIIFLALLTLVPLVIVPWQTVGTWRSANNHKSRGGRAFWAGLAKLVLALGVMRTAVDTAELVPIYSQILTQVTAPDPFPSATITLAAGGREVVLDGGIGSGVSGRLMEVLNANPTVRVVRLRSIGGWIKEGRIAGEALKQRGISTYVDEYCHSACTMIFLAGKERWLGENGQLGFHAPHSPGLTDGQLASMISQDRQALIDLGVPAAFAAKAMATPHGELWLPGPSELLSAKLINGVADDAAYKARGDLLPVDFRSKAEAALSDPFYLAIKVADPATYDQILDRVDQALKGGADRKSLAADLQKLVRPFARPYVSKASEDVVLGLGWVNLDYMRQLLRADPETCVAFVGGPDKGAAMKTPLTSFPEIYSRDLTLNTRAIATGSGSSVIVPNRVDLVRQFNSTFAGFLIRPDLRPDLFKKDKLSAAEFLPYCELNIAWYEEILRLPRADAVRMLRFLFKS